MVSDCFRKKLGHLMNFYTVDVVSLTVSFYSKSIILQ